MYSAFDGGKKLLGDKSYAVQQDPQGGWFVCMMVCIIPNKSFLCDSYV